jgi:prepilin-type processing-associated H-X9-DG protein
MNGAAANESNASDVLGLARSLRSDFKNVWMCNYAYPKDTFGTSTENDNPYYSTHAGVRQKKLADLKAIMTKSSSYTGSGSGPLPAPDINRLIVACDGSGQLDVLVANPGGYAQAERMLDPYRWVHGGRMNVLFMDGHVESVGKTDVALQISSIWCHLYYATN